MRAIFQDLGCSAHAAKAVVEDQGIGILDGLCFLKDGDAETLYKTVKHPGAAAGGNIRVANLGHLISQKAEMNIKLAAYYLRYSEKISQVCQPTDLTVQAIRTIMDLHDSDGNWDNPKAPSSMKEIGERNLMGLMNFQEVLRNNKHALGLHHQKGDHTQGERRY